jgi:hypothetical protein
LVLLAVEGITIPRIFPLLTLHVFIGMLLIPPVLLKMATTSYRFARYYLGSPAYRRKGPPEPVLRLLGPVVILLTLTVLGTGVALVLRGGATLLRLHQVSFVLWFCAMAVHVLAHFLDTARLAPRDYYWRTRRQVVGAGLRQWTLAAALAVGFLLGALFIGQATTYKAQFVFVHHAAVTATAQGAARR